MSANGKNGISDFAAFRSFLLDTRGLLHLNEPIHYKKIIAILRELELSEEEKNNLRTLEVEIEKCSAPFVFYKQDRHIPLEEQNKLIFYGEGIHLDSKLLKKVYSLSISERSEYYFNYVLVTRQQLSYLLYLVNLIDKYQSDDTLPKITFEHYPLESYVSKK